MLGLDPKFCIVSYAVVADKFNEGKNITECFIPLIEAALIKVNDNIIEKRKVAHLFSEIYGFCMPLTILDDLVRALAKQKKVSYLRGECLEIHHELLGEYDSKLDLRLRMLENEFDRFMRSKKMNINRAEIPTIISRFIYNNALEMNSFFRYDSDFEAAINNNDQYEKYIVEFLLSERSGCSDCYRFIEEIYSGVIISSLLQLGKDALMDIDDDPFNIENVLLDSNFIFRLLDLQTSYENKASLETYNLLKEKGCRLWVLPITIQQIFDTITACMHDLFPTTDSYSRIIKEDRFSGLHSAYLRRGLTLSDLQEVKSGLVNTLKDDFKILKFTGSVADEGSIMPEEVSSLQKAKQNSNLDGIKHDLQIILTVRNQRDSMITRMDEANWWVLTDDIKLAKWNHSNNKKSIPECLTESQLATLYWLKDPQKTTTTGLCNTILALRNKELYDNVAYNRITKEIERQKKRYESNPKKLDSLALVFTSNCLSLDELVLAEPNKTDELFDDKLAKADAFILENQVLINEQVILKEMIDMFDKQLEQMRLGKSYLSDTITKETEEHIDTLRNFSNEKKETKKQLEEELRLLNNQLQVLMRRYKNEAYCLLFLMLIIFTVIMYLIETRTILFTILSEKLYFTTLTIICILIYIICIIFKAESKEEVPIKLFDEILSFYLSRVRKDRLQPYQKKIRILEKEIYSINLEIVDIENKIESKLINKQDKEDAVNIDAC